MPPALERLIRVLSRLPGVGKRSAERMAMRILQDSSGGLNRELVDALLEMAKFVKPCRRCGYVTDRSRDPCRICRDPNRNPAFLCLVEEVGDIDLIEASESFDGQYFCLMGKVSPMRGLTLKQDRMDVLLRRVEEDQVKEILLALNADVESDATAGFLHELLDPLGVKLSRLALGIPAGSGVSYVDPVTLARAISARQDL